MKKLKCEACGGTEIKKVGDDLFECQNCGLQYSTSEVKKIFAEVSGTVKVDNSDKLESLYKLARRAKDTNNATDAIKYYEMILIEDPNSWEAILYSKSFKADICTIAQISDVADDIKSCIKMVFKLICEQFKDAKVKEEKINEASGIIIEKLNSLSDATVNSADNMYQQYINAHIHADWSDFERISEKARSRMVPIGLGYIELGDALFIAFPQPNKDAKDLIINTWEAGLLSMQYIKKGVISSQKHNYNQKNADMLRSLGTIETATVKKIKSLEPNYQASTETQTLKTNASSGSVYEVVCILFGTIFIFSGLIIITFCLVDDDEILGAACGFIIQCVGAFLIKEGKKKRFLKNKQNKNVKESQGNGLSIFILLLGCTMALFGTGGVLFFLVEGEILAMLGMALLGFIGVFLIKIATRDLKYNH